MFSGYKLYSVSFNLYGLQNNIVDPTIDFKGGPSLINDLHHISEKVDISEVFHCDGLLLCTTSYDRLVVWNPCNGQTRWIQLPYRRNTYSRVALGYENNKSCHSYKILRCCDRIFSPIQGIVGFEIYEFSSDSWRVPDDFVPDGFMLRKGVSLKGNTYRLSLDIKDKSIFLLSFDFTTERFRRLCLPFASPSFDTITLSSVKEEQLSVLHQRRSTQEVVEIWVTTDDRIDQTNVLSWRKVLAVDLITRCSYTSHVSFFIDEEKKVAVCIDERFGVKNNGNIVCIIGKDTEYKEIIFGETNGSRWPSLFNYVPSLAQI